MASELAPGLAGLTDVELQTLVDIQCAALPIRPLRRRDHLLFTAHRQTWAELHARGWQRPLVPTDTPGTFAFVWRHDPTLDIRNVRSELTR